MTAHTAAANAVMVCVGTSASGALRSRQSRSIGWSAGREGGSHPGTTFAGPRTAVAVCPAPLSSTRIVQASGQATAHPSPQSGNARRVRAGSASKQRTPGVGSTAPDTEPLSPWWGTGATGRRPRRVSSGAKPLSGPMDVRASSCLARRVGQAGCNGGTAAGVLGVRGGDVWAGHAVDTAPTQGR
jgi:hypothetical protein